MKHSVEVVVPLTLEIPEDNKDKLRTNLQCLWGRLGLAAGLVVATDEDVIKELSRNIVEGFPNGPSYLGEVDIDYTFSFPNPTIIKIV